MGFHEQGLSKEAETPRENGKRDHPTRSEVESANFTDASILPLRTEMKLELLSGHG